MSKALEIGTRIGKAMARDVLADKLPCKWVGLNDQDGDRLTAVGINPGSDEWEAAEQAAKDAYLEAVTDSLQGT